MRSTITIGGRVLPVSRPLDLDAQLVAATGCASGEIDNLTADASRAASALAPLLGGDAPPHAELAALIASDRDAVAAIRDVYADLDAAPVAAPMAALDEEIER